MKDKNTNVNAIELNNINLNFLFKIYFKWKYFIIVSILISFIYNVYKLRNAEYLYEVSLQIIAVTTFENSKSLSPQNPLADYFGVSSSNSSSDFSLYKSLLKSKIIAEKLSENDIFLQRLLEDSWDPKNRKIKSGSINFSTKLRNSIKNLLGIPVFSGSLSPKDYIYNFLQSIIIKPGENPNFLELIIQTSKTKKAVYLINAVHNETDNLLKDRSLLRATNNLDFIKSKLLTVKQQDQKQTLINSLSSQQNVIMSSSTNLPYVAEPFGSPSISNRPVAPKPKLVLAISIIYSLIFSLFFAPIIEIFIFSIRKSSD